MLGSSVLLATIISFSFFLSLVFCRGYGNVVVTLAASCSQKNHRLNIIYIMIVLVVLIIIVLCCCTTIIAT